MQIMEVRCKIAQGNKSAHSRYQYAGTKRFVNFDCVLSADETGLSLN